MRITSSSVTASVVGVGWAAIIGGEIGRLHSAHFGAKRLKTYHRRTSAIVANVVYRFSTLLSADAQRPRS